jgi:hypothetical protein
VISAQTPTANIAAITGLQMDMQLMFHCALRKQPIMSAAAL